MQDTAVDRAHRIGQDHTNSKPKQKCKLHHSLHNMYTLNSCVSCKEKIGKTSSSWPHWKSHKLLEDANSLVKDNGAVNFVMLASMSIES